MRPFWHPVSALVLSDPPTLASPTLVKLLLRSQGSLELRYAGDRMVPATRHGVPLHLRPLGTRAISVGEAVVAAPAGIPDLFRVDRIEGDDVLLGADADPDESVRAAIGCILAGTDLPHRRDRRTRRRLRRLRLDLVEAVRHGADRAEDAASTVRDKYEGQAEFYRAAAGPSLDEAVLARMRQVTRPAGSVLVVGCGTGRDCFAIAEMGYRSVGLDFAPAMIRVAREEAGRRGVEATFLEGDLRVVALEPGSLAGVIFTYDVYSFLPSRRERVDVLRMLARSLEPGGRIFLSARRVRRGWDRVVLTILRWNGKSARKEWGVAHTRYVTSDGRLRRSFVRMFTDRQLRRETREAGLVGSAWVGGHGEYRSEETIHK